MVGIVVVSHSRALAEAAVALAMEMVHGSPPPVAIAAGIDAGTFGTDATAVRKAIESVDSPDGVVVIMDLGSAVLSTDLALDLLDPGTQARVEVTDAPFVEGLVGAIVQAAVGADRSSVVAEAAAGLAGKSAHLGHTQLETVELGEPEASATFRVSNVHGLHARPAARLVAEVKRHDAMATFRNLTTDSAAVSGDSLSRVAALGAVKGSHMEVAASGPHAQNLVNAVVSLAARQFDELEESQPAIATVPSDRAQPASPGIAIGPKFMLGAEPPRVEISKSDDPGAEWRRLRESLASVRTDIARVRLRVAHDAGDAEAGIFDAHLMLLEDRDILDRVRARIEDGASAAAAWQDTITGVESEWAALADPYLNARAADVRAVGDQVLRAMLGGAREKVTHEGVLVAEDLTPADTADLDPSRVQAVVTAYGSATSHSAILAGSLGIPAVVGAGRWVLDIPDGATMIVDGSDGSVIVHPPDGVLATYRRHAEEQAVRREEQERRAHQPALTTDGVGVAVEANVGSVAATDAAVRAGADGIGLLRSEFLFLGRNVAPGIDEQEAMYRQVAERLDGRRLTIRTLDVGGDKPLPYVPTPMEDNPFLGVRGLRLSLLHPDVLYEQLVAIVRVAADHPVSVMFPMVTSLAEVKVCRDAVSKAGVEVGIEPGRLEIGIMVEVPSAALNASSLAPYVDFFSIGTNDLTQYTLAVERGNEGVSAIADALDPAVLKLVNMVCVGAAGHDVRVAVCGEVAADPVAVPILVGLGVHELSVSPPAVATVKEVVRGWSHAAMRQVANDALGQESASRVRELGEGS